jgi:dTDP-4-amino-4,6-dideoxygalactose transaminase
MINVTKAYLPDRTKYIEYVNKIFDSGWVTNGGALVKELEVRLAEYLGVENIVLVANGTLALETAYRLLGLSGEVVTTPFSFVATTSSLVSHGITPIFADIDRRTFNIDPERIKEAVSERTSAIVAVHVFGNPCDVSSISAIANEQDIKVIYDAAHAFSVRTRGESILNCGDVSTLSFHATKIFHTIEGGALVIQDGELVESARRLINFGIDGPDSVSALGLNAKMNEFEAAMGLCVLEDIDNILDARQVIAERYYDCLGDSVEFQRHEDPLAINHNYFPILLKDELQLLSTQNDLNSAGIFPRRYFKPSLDQLSYLERGERMPISNDVSSRILALPIYPGLSRSDQMRIISIIQKSIR